MRISDWSSDVSSSDLLGAHPLPHGCHVGEKSEVPEGCGLHVESEILPAEWPATLRQVASQIPAPAAVLVRSGDEFPRGIPLREPRRPHRLRLGPDETMRAELLELARSEEHTSELQSLMRSSYAVFCLKKKNQEYKSN